jgi:protein subunit release factor B
VEPVILRLKEVNMVTPEKRLALEQKFISLNIKPNDIIEKFMTSGNKGGQKANKTSNAVYLKHIPTGIEVKCKESRERDLNRFLARRTLAFKIEELTTGTSERMRGFEKIRKQKDRKRRRNMAV